VRVVAALGFVGVMASMYAVPDNWVNNHESVATWVFVALYLVTGALIARWWAIPLAFVPVVLAIPRGTAGDVDGVALWKWTLLDTVVAFVWIMLVGVLIGWGLRRWRAARTGGGARAGAGN
jgi:hypothetical protein